MLERLASPSLGLPVVRLDFQCLGVIGNGPVEVAFLGEGQAAVDISQGQACIQLQGFVKVADGPIEIALPGISGAAVEITQRQLGIEANGPRVVGNGAGRVLLLDVGQAAVDIGLRRPRVDGQGRCVFGDGPVEIALGGVCIAAALECRCVVRIEFQRPGELGNGPVGVALLTKSDAPLNASGSLLGAFAMRRCGDLRAAATAGAFSAWGGKGPAAEQSSLPGPRRSRRPPGNGPGRASSEQFPPTGAKLFFFLVVRLGRPQKGEVAGAAKAIDVRRRPDGCPFQPSYLLGGGELQHVADRRAQGGICPCRRVIQHGTKDAPFQAQAEVDQFHSPAGGVLADQQAARLNAPVENAAPVRRFQGIRHGPEDGQHIGGIERSVLGHVIGQRNAVKMIADQERPILGTVGEIAIAQPNDGRDTPACRAAEPAGISR